MSNFEKLGKQISEVDATIEAWIAKLGLGYNHFAVLYSLVAAENGQCTQKQICDEWLLPKQTVFNVCKEYKEKGWIEFSESAVDKREKNDAFNRRRQGEGGTGLAGDTAVGG